MKEEKEREEKEREEKRGKDLFEVDRQEDTGFLN